MARGDWDKVIDIGGGGGARMPPFGRGRLPSLSALRGLATVALALLLLLTTYYQVEPDQIGVVQRFGAFVGTSEPGPHLKLPFGIETVTKVPVQRQLKMEFGFRTTRAGVRSQFAADNDLTRGESIMLTGDLN